VALAPPELIKHRVPLGLVAVLLLSNLEHTCVQRSGRQEEGSAGQSKQWQGDSV
jgi:hypothetical protein